MTQNTQIVSKTRLMYSAMVFVLCYLVMILCAFCMIVLNEPSGWTQYFVNYYQRFLSMCVCILLLCLVTYYYYYFEDREFLANANGAIMIFTSFIVSLLINYVIGRFISVYARPIAIYPLVMLFLLNRRQSIMLNFVFSLLLYTIDTYSNNSVITGLRSEIYYYLLLQVVLGCIAVFMASKVRTRIGLLLVGGLLSVPTAATVLILEMPQGVFNSWVDVMIAISYRIMGIVSSSVFALALLPLYEVVFNRLTVFRLRELTGANAPLLKRLRAEAPGTFNHCLIVAQLAETCAIAIGENAELARAAAYYHDVGKLKQPECFTENQTGYNVHDEITPELSADIISSHTRDGYDIRRKRTCRTRLPMLRLSTTAPFP